MGKPKVLIMDDEPQMQDLIRLSLQRDFATLEAEYGLMALRVLRTEQWGIGYRFTENQNA